MLEQVKELSGFDVGADPELFWHAWLGHWTGTQSGDMADMLIQKYLETHEWVKEQTRG